MPRRILVAEEGSTEWQLHADTIKQLTSGGKIEARGMRSNDFTERTPAFLPFIATNDYPTVRYADAALKRRLVGFPFSRQIPLSEEDAGFRTRFLARDRAAVLMWMLEGFDRYCHEGLGAPPGEAALATAELRQALNPADIFLHECTTTKPLASGEPPRVSASVLFQALQDWWDEQKLKPSELPTKNAFGRHLTDSGYPVGLPGKRNEGGSRSRYRLGLRLKRAGDD
jgi:phage/plasmid-associated DNA primase